ncbi:MAG: hypothetical protein O3A10_09795 [Chloroflexi bacterium]|nr:hypothetical protein [Chloroflexota bacterium]MDA1147968.1 hypothetical protein [Chloroflexota bacterium]
MLVRIDPFGDRDGMRIGSAGAQPADAGASDRSEGATDAGGGAGALPASVPNGAPAIRRTEARSPRVGGCPLRELLREYRISGEVARKEQLESSKKGGIEQTKIPYFDEYGCRLGDRVLIDLSEPSQGRWTGQSPNVLYGLSRSRDAIQAGVVFLFESEAGCLRFWSEGFPALAVPGSGAWEIARNSPVLDDVQMIYVVGDSETLASAADSLEGASFLDRLGFLVLSEEADLLGPEITGVEFQQLLGNCMERAVSWNDYQESRSSEIRATTSSECEDLLQSTSILDEFVADLWQCGVVGEERGGKLLYLALVSRLTDRPVSVVVKAASSSGKSFLAKKVLTFFPEDAFQWLSGMSERALAYSKEPLRHRFLVIAEADGAQGDFQDYLLRTLLSEGRIRYETVMDTGNGLETVIIEREGPTGLLLTTTRITLHPENETRLFSLPVDESIEQTRDVVRELVREDRPEVDLSRWHALQHWLGAGSTAVSVPFGPALAEMVDVRALRVRRDFSAVISLIRSNALLHQQHREVTADGQVVADLDDYAVVYELVADLMAEGIGATVPPGVRRVVDAVDELTSGPQHYGDDPVAVSNNELSEHLQLDKSTISRRVAEALRSGYLHDLVDRRRREKQLVIHDPMPGDTSVLPSPEELGVAWLQSVAPTRPRRVGPRRPAAAAPAAAPIGDYVD